MKNIVLFVVFLFGGLVFSQNFASGSFEYELVNNQAIITTCLPHAIVKDSTTSQESIYIPSELDGYRVAGIDYNAFLRCSANILYIPSTVTSIDGGAFRFSAEWDEIVVDKNNPVYYFENGALFDKKQNMLHTYFYKQEEKTYTIPSSITRIGDYAFYDWMTLEHIEIPKTILFIGDYAFYRNKALEAITIPNSVTHIGKGAFAYAGIQEITLSEGLTKIEDNLFESTSLSSIRIPHGVTTIGESTFQFCRNLRTVEIPSTVKTIESGAFSFTYGLSTVVIPKSVNQIEAGAFWQANALRSIEVDKNNPVYVFENGSLVDKKNRILHTFLRTQGSTYTVPTSIKHIGDRAFDGKNISNVLLHDSIETIGNKAFYETKIKSIDIPDSVISIGDEAFSFAKDLKTVRLSKALKTIGKQAFYICESLEEIEIPASVVSIGEAAFAKCHELYMHVPNNEIFKMIDGALIDTKQNIVLAYLISNTAHTYTVPSFVTRIGDYAFEYSTLEEVIVPNSVTSIGESAFSDCKNLRYLDIPNSVVSIGRDAFTGSPGLANIYLPNSLTVERLVK